MWNATDGNYCRGDLVKEFLGHRLHPNITDPDAPQGQYQTEAVVSSEGIDKIRIKPMGPMSQCRRVVTATNIEDMFLFPMMETDEHGDITVDNRDCTFTQFVHASEVDLRKYIANCDEYLYHDITLQAEKEFDTILHQDCLWQQDEARKAHFFV